MNKRALILIAAVAASMLGGCASYERMYGQYAALQAQACGDERQPMVEFTDSGGKPIKIYERSAPCRIEAPDNPGRIAADTATGVAGAAVKGIIGFKALDELGGVLKRGYDRAGDQVGGDGVIGQQNADILTDKTAPPPEPIVVEQPEPVIVEPGDGE